MINRRLYESINSSNLYTRNNNSEAHMKKISEIKCRETQFKRNNFRRDIKTSQDQRSRNSPFNTAFIDRVNRQNECMYSKIKKICNANGSKVLLL